MNGVPLITCCKGALLSILYMCTLLTTILWSDQPKILLLLTFALGTMPFNGNTWNAWRGNINAARNQNLNQDPCPAWNTDLAMEWLLMQCGMNTRNKHQAWHNEGMVQLSDCVIFRPKDVDEFDNFGELNGNANGTTAFHVGKIKQLWLHGMVRWLRIQAENGNELDAMDFTHEVQYEMVEEYQLNKAMDDEDAESPKEPPKFTGLNFCAFEMHSKNFLNGVPLSRSNVPLSYVLRDEGDPPEDATPEELQIYAIALDGPQCRRDQQKVYRYLRGWLIDAPGRIWIEPYDRTQDGGHAWLALTGHYNGPDCVWGHVLQA